MSKERNIDDNDLKGVSGGAGFQNLDGGSGSTDPGTRVGSDPSDPGSGGGVGNPGGFDPEGQSGDGLQELE